MRRRSEAVSVGEVSLTAQRPATRPAALDRSAISALAWNRRRAHRAAHGTGVSLVVTYTADSVAGLTVPDTPLTRDITDYVREAEDDLLFNHSRRVYFFGVLQGRRRGLKPDPELLYAGAMFHDVGLTEPYRSTSTLRFEVDSANVARDFLLDRGVERDLVRTVWLSIALHTTPGVPRFLDPEIDLVSAGVETDVLGIDLDALAPEAVAAVTGAHPRPDFKRRILGAFTDGVRRRPHTTFGTVNADVLDHYDESFTRDDFVEVILASGWPE
jgi:HD domain